MQYVPFRILRPVGIGNVLEVEKEGDVQYEDRCNVVTELFQQYLIAPHYVAELGLANGEKVYIPFEYGTDGRTTVAGTLVTANGSEGILRR